MPHNHTDYTFIGTEGDDVFYGTGGYDSTGPKGNDLIFGLGGNDILVGSSGHDEIHGGDGNDLIDGYKGEDHLYGGAGSDTFYYGYPGFSRADRPNLMDTIFDFETGVDKIELSGGYFAGADWSNVTVTPDSGGWLVFVDVPHFAYPDMTVMVLGTEPVETDFIFS